MKNKYHRKLIQSVVSTAALGATIAYAGPIETTAAPITVPSEEDFISGSLNFDYSSHFFSYGNDVFNDGSDPFQLGFYPSGEVAIELPAGFSAAVGFWAEIHEKTGSTTTIGGNIQEVDVYASLSYTYEKFTVGVTYQNWFYLGDVEDILDVTFSYDTFLSPSLTVHHRLDAGAAGTLGGDEGTILVLGLEHGLEAGPVSISFPFNLAYFLDSGYHTPTGNQGFGYASLGVAASLPLSFIAEGYGDWSLNAGVNYYITDTTVVGVGLNPEDRFIATNIGLSVAF